MKIISVINQKGGVGKTTSAVNLAAALAMAGKEILLVDLDPQANASSAIGFTHIHGPSVYDLLLNDASLSECIIPTDIPNMDLLPSDPNLSGAEVELVSALNRERRLATALNNSKNWDYIIIDCPPSLGLLTINALTAATDVIVPLQCEYFALEGLSRLLETIKLIQQHLNPGLSLTGILLTMFDARNNICHQVAEEVTRHFQWSVFETVIPRNVRLSEAPSFGKPIQLYDPECKGSKSYHDLAEELLHRLESGLLNETNIPKLNNDPAKKVKVA